MLESISQNRGRGRGASLPVHADLQLEAMMSKASPKLMQAAANGKHIREATLFGVKSGESRHEFLKIKLQPILISSYQTGGSSGEIPVDSFSLNFDKIEFEFTPQNADGSAGDTVRGSWDFKSNQAN